MIVMFMNQNQERLFREMVDIISNPNLSLMQMFDKLEMYWGIDHVTDDTVIRFQGNLLREMVNENRRLDDVIEGELISGLLN